MSESQVATAEKTQVEPALATANVKRLAAGTGVALCGRLAGRGLRLLIDIGLARLLGPAQFGLYATGWALTRIVTLVAPIGLNSGVIRFGARYCGEDDARLKGVIVQSVLTAALCSTAIAVICFTNAEWLSRHVFHKPGLAMVIRWDAVAFPLLTLLAVIAAATRISQRMKFAVLAEDVSQPAVELLLILVLLLAFGAGLRGALAACIASLVVSLGLGIHYLLRLFPCLAAPGVVASLPGRALVMFSVPASLTGVLGVLTLWVNRLLVAYYRPPAEVGIYQAASYIPVSVGIVVGAAGAIFSPMIAAISQRGQAASIRELYKVSTKWTLYMALPPIIIMCFAPRELMTVLFGHAYTVGASALVIMAFAQLMNAASGCVGILLVMSGHQRITSLLFASMFVLNLVLSVLFIPRWGIEGAAWTTVCTGAGLWIPAVFIAWHILRVQPYDRRYLKLLLATVLACVATQVTGPVTSPLGRLLLVSASTVGVFWGTLLVFGLDPEDHQFKLRIQAALRLD